MQDEDTVTRFLGTIHTTSLTHKIDTRKNWLLATPSVREQDIWELFADDDEFVEGDDAVAVLV